MNRIKQLCGGRLRPLLLSFLMTMLGFFFLLSLLWVQIQAARGGFFDLDKPIAELVSSPQATLLIKTGEEEKQISLDWLETAAQYYQRLERWVVPPELRFASRAGLMVQNLVEDARKQQRERDFYRNAGEV